MFSASRRMASSTSLGPFEGNVVSASALDLWPCELVPAGNCPCPSVDTGLMQGLVAADACHDRQVSPVAGGERDPVIDDRLPGDKVDDHRPAASKLLFGTATEQRPSDSTLVLDR